MKIKRSAVVTSLIFLISFTSLMLLLSVSLIAKEENENTEVKRQSSQGVLSEELFKHKVTNYSSDSTQVNFHVDIIQEHYKSKNKNKSERFIIHRFPLFKRNEK